MSRFEQIPLRKLKVVLGAQALRDATEKSEPYVIPLPNGHVRHNVRNGHHAPDPIEQHFKRERLPGFGDAYNVRSMCVVCRKEFTGDIREGVMDWENSHILSRCARSSY